jgi:D-alanyl-lipoteichoic acid acyltransferase DltB (MBOAT superfamily)
VLFNSYAFLLVFLPLALVGFGLACRLGAQAGGLFLGAISLLFYAWPAPQFLPVLLASIAGNFVAARLMLRASHAPQLQMCILATAIATNLAALFHYKYLALLLQTVGVTASASALPLGISFFTFTQIGLLLDCRGPDAPRHSLLHHTFFVAFFPHLIAGPVLRSREVLPQVTDAATWRLQASSVAQGGFIFCLGLLKKTLLADPIGQFATGAFADPTSLTMLPAWQAASAYSLQLYFDFSGYSDMAVGLARMFNLRFPANFDSPYKAQSVIEYWQRWHITLTSFLTAHVYSPLALGLMRRRGARGLSTGRDAQRTPGGFAAMLVLPTTATIVLAGMWHGASWNYLIFGLLHAVFLSVNHAWRILWPNARSRAAICVAARVALTYLCVLVASVVFGTASPDAALRVLSGMVGLHGILPPGWSASLPRGVVEAAWFAALYTIVWGTPNTSQIAGMHGLAMPRALSGFAWRPALPWALASGFAAALGLLSIGGTSEFVYFRF